MPTTNVWRGRSVIREGEGQRPSPKFGASPRISAVGSRDSIQGENQQSLVALVNDAAERINGAFAVPAFTCAALEHLTKLVFERLMIFLEALHRAPLLGCPACFGPFHRTMA